MTRPLIALALLLTLLAAACNDNADSPAASITPNPDLPANESLLFIARGDASARDGHLTIDTTHVEWFTDRPDRMAGFTTLETFAALWQTAFAGDPPTAAIAGNGLQAIVTVDSATATKDGLDLTFDDINSSVPDGGLGSVSLFVDSATATTGCDAVSISFGQNRQVIITAGPNAFKNNDVIKITWGDNAANDQDSLDNPLLPGMYVSSAHTYSADSWDPRIDGLSGCTRTWSIDCNPTVCTE